MNIATRIQKKPTFISFFLFFADTLKCCPLVTVVASRGPRGSPQTEIVSCSRFASRLCVLLFKLLILVQDGLLYASPCNVFAHAVIQRRKAGEPQEGDHVADQDELEEPLKWDRPTKSQKPVRKLNPDEL